MVNKGKMWSPGTCREPVMGGSRQLCHPHGRDWGRGRFRLRARTLADPEDGGGPPSLDTASHLPEPKQTTEDCAVVSSERVQTRCHTHGRAHAHTWHTSIHHTRQATHAQHMQVHAHVYTRVHAACHTCVHTSYTMHTHADARSHMHTSHADTHHTCMHGPRGLSEASLLVHASGVFRLKANQTGKALYGCNPRAEGGRAPDFRDSERPQAAGPGQEAERASHME